MDNIIENETISLSNIIILGRLGRGATSHVFKVQHSKNKKVYAMKVIDKKDKLYSKQSFQRQIDIHKRLSHKNIVKLISDIEDIDNHYVLTQYCQEGEITKLIMKDIDEHKIKQIVYQIAQGLNYMHAKGIAHCDLKLSNLLIQKEQIKICDFGFSKQIDKVKETTQKSLYGTLFYLAPEIMRQNQRIYFQQGDIWAFGIILLIIITKKQPYTGKNFKQIRKQILSGQKTSITQQVSQSLKHLVQSMLEQDPLKRITLKTIINHDFLQEIRMLNNNYETQQQQIAQKWQFKRKKTLKTQEIDQTKQKVYKVTENSHDNDKTIKNLGKIQYKTSEIKLNTQQMTSQDAVANQSKGIQQKAVNFIEARLIRPLGQFKYETKNDGFIKILKNGDLQVKVKNICYSIIKNGHILKLQNRQYQFKKLKEQRRGKLKKFYGLYEYAFQVIDILKKRNFYETFVQKRNGKEILVGLNKIDKKMIVLTKINNELTTIQYIKDSTCCHIKQEGDRLRQIAVKDISQGQLYQLFRFMEKKSKQLLQ